MKVLGVDYGEKRVGVAFADTEAPVAIPRDVIPAHQAVSILAVLCRKEKISRIVLGLPVTLRGEEGAMAKRVRRFGQRLYVVTTCPVDFYDERFSTKGLPRVGVRSVDAAAAARILQGWLDTQDGKRGTIET